VVTEGGRLEVPDRSELPGPDTMTFDGLETYVALMRRCWAQRPEDRPAFQEIISDLRELLSATLAKTGRGVALHPTQPSWAGLDAAAGSDKDAAPRGTISPNDSQSSIAKSALAAAVPSMKSASGQEGTARAVEGVSPTAASLGSGEGSLEVGASASLPGSPYASTTVNTGSLLDPEDLQHGWASKLRSSFGPKGR
jgi:hypothetical protein